MGSDMIMLNTFDVFNPEIAGLYKCENPINELKNLTGKIVGINLEPIDHSAEMLETMDEISIGRHATVETFKKAEELGVDFISLTGNPGTGVSNHAINEAIKTAKEHYSGIIVAGKMHGAGVAESVLDFDAISGFIENGADVVMIPAAGTVYGVTLEDVIKACRLIRSKGKLSLVANGTSQDGAQEETIREMAIANKMAGADIHHIGDSGPGGIAPWRNILALSVAIRGERHAVRMMAMSVNR